MISVKEAENIILAHAKRSPAANVFLKKSYGRILRENVVADRDYPPFHRSTMDGIAINFKSFQQGIRVFPVEGIQPAGKKQMSLMNDQSCIEVMTGAIVPKRCNCVIPYEAVLITKNQAHIKNKLHLSAMDNIRARGTECKMGSLLLKKYTQLFAPQMAIAASVGKTKIKISRSPKVVILSTGDELVDVSKVPKLFQIRKSNSLSVQALIKSLGVSEVHCRHVKDHLKLVKNKLANLLKSYDIVIISGGVSMGKFDFIPQSLTDLEVKILFHKVAQKPGKPLLFGKHKSGKIVFGLPGNPVSTLICTYRYILPYIRCVLGMNPSQETWVSLSDNFTAGPHALTPTPPTSLGFKDGGTVARVKSNFTYFLPVNTCMTRQGKLVASPMKIVGSSDQASFAKCDGFVELKAGRHSFKKGSIHRYYSMRDPM